MSENQMDVNATESKMKCVGKAIVIAFLSLVFVVVGFCSLCCYIVTGDNYAVKAELKAQSGESYLTVPGLISTNSSNVKVAENNEGKINQLSKAAIDIERYSFFQTLPDINTLVDWRIWIACYYNFMDTCFSRQML